MLVNDKIYGEFEIDNPTIHDLIATQPFQRLKDVSQQSGPNLVFPDKFQTTRFEHSLGVWHILNTLGASLEVQVAGLLHDIGHTAFSHAVEMAIGDVGFHENNDELIEGFDEIQKILSESKIILKNIDDYTEIKRSLPFIGADRIDYSVRDWYAATLQETNLGKDVLSNIILQNGEICFTDVDIARQFANTGHESLKLVIYNPTNSVIESALIGMIRDAYNLGIATKPDFMKTNDHLWNLLMNNKAKLNPKHVQIFEQKFEVVPADANDFDILNTGGSKPRYYDPLVLINDVEPKQLTEIDEEYRKQFEEFKKYVDYRQAGTYWKVKFL